MPQRRQGVMSSFMHSIKGRLILASILLLPLACALLGWSLERAYTHSLIESQKRQMIIQAYALMASAELENDTLWLPEQMTDDRLNQVSSGMFAQVVKAGDKNPLWQSLSFGGDQKHFEDFDGDLRPGESDFNAVFLNDEKSENIFVLNYKVEWESDEGDALPFIFSVYESSDGHQLQLDSYRQTLWFWLILIAITLVLLQLVILVWGLRPLSRVVDDLQAVKEGCAATLEGDYPAELRSVTSSINKLLEHESSQRERYRNTLADLAHSIKNPVAIIFGALNTLRQTHQVDALDDIEAQNDRINQIISYQLSRAVGQSSAPFNQAIPIKPVAEQVVSAMSKVYVDKEPIFDVQIDDAMFKGDKGDLFELVGNLVDNACKYGKQRVRIKAANKESQLSLVIEDDGSGVSEAQKTELLKRGQRADTKQAGQGIGLALVEDIVDSYGGTIELAKSDLGGLKVEVLL